ncbi:hypothetical protein ACFE04_017505 [Oxalis oulophora]
MDDKNERKRRSNGDDDHEVSNNNINKRKKKMMNKMRLSNNLFIRGKMGIKCHTVRTRRRILIHKHTFISIVYQIKRQLLLLFIGREKNYSFWYDPWVHGKALKDKYPGIEITFSELSRYCKVCDVWKQNEWKLPDPVTTSLINAWADIKNIDGNVLEEDKIVWLPNPTEQHLRILLCFALR